MTHKELAGAAYEAVKRIRGALEAQARDLIEDVKKGCRTYGEVEKVLNLVEWWIRPENDEVSLTIIHTVKEQLEQEKSRLLLAGSSFRES